MVKIIPGVSKKALIHNLKLYRGACASVNRQISKDDTTKPKGISSESFDALLQYGTGQFIEDMKKAFNITEKTFILNIFLNYMYLYYYCSLCFVFKNYHTK